MMEQESGVRNRTNGINRVTEEKPREKKIRKCQLDIPVHSPKDSLLSSSSGYTNYRGFFNLCFIILILSNTRVALENIIKYGILVDPINMIIMFFSKPNIRPLMNLMLVSNIFILLSLEIEKRMVKCKSNRFGLILASINVFALLLLPTLVFSLGFYNPIGASICCMIYSIISLKLTSYHMVNYWCRTQVSQNCPDLPNGNNSKDFSGNGTDSRNGHTTSRVMYPDNISRSDLYYFMFAPTLCYELNFPRSSRIRKRFLIKRLLESIFLFQLGIGLIQQWMVPTITNSLEPLKEMSFSRMLERLLKLAVPNLCIWLIFFYFFFHSLLNLIAEVLRFSDREFYRDWWNSKSVEYFWQNWNIPVHRWCVRHVYIPLLNCETIRINRFWASVVVFFLSAFFHEYMVSVPLNMYRIWAFTGMVLQLPFSFLVRRFFNTQSANVAVWISIIIGQPLCILMYYHDYYVIHVASR